MDRKQQVEATTTIMRNSSFFFFFSLNNTWPFLACALAHFFLFFVFFAGFRIALLSVLLMVMTGCQPSSAIPRLNNAMLWKRLGLNRAIGGERPQITSSKKKGESTVYYIKLPPQPHYYIPLNLLPSSGSGSGYQQKNTPEPFETVTNIRLVLAS